MKEFIRSYFVHNVLDGFSSKKGVINRLFESFKNEKLPAYGKSENIGFKSAIIGVRIPPAGMQRLAMRTTFLADLGLLALAVLNLLQFGLATVYYTAKTVLGAVMAPVMLAVMPKEEAVQLLIRPADTLLFSLTVMAYQVAVPFMIVIKALHTAVLAVKGDQNLFEPTTQTNSQTDPSVEVIVETQTQIQPDVAKEMNMGPIDPFRHVQSSDVEITAFPTINN